MRALYLPQARADGKPFWLDVAHFPDLASLRSPAPCYSLTDHSIR
ncbi:hypothetical protein N9X12_06060 [Alphaproteobacteria bacterium]|nr:hypothetical protein [Alphaproteobacteria bacterium]